MEEWPGGSGWMERAAGDLGKGRRWEFWLRQKAWRRVMEDIKAGLSAASTAELTEYILDSDSASVKVYSRLSSCLIYPLYDILSDVAINLIMTMAGSVDESA